MFRKEKLFFTIACLSIFLAIASPVLSQTVGRFESFYTEYQEKGTAKKWLVYGGLALATGAVLYFSGGTAYAALGPVIKSIGSTIGGTMGLHGVAATKAGLAWLGGGAIASGGLGVKGGAALLVAGLEFSTAPVWEYGMDAILGKDSVPEKVRYENSKLLAKLPPFINTYGPEVYQKAIKNFERYRHDEPTSSEHNQAIFKRVIYDLDDYKFESKFFERDKTAKKRFDHEYSRVLLAKAICKFAIYDYEGAFIDANNAYNRLEETTVGLFITSVSGVLTNKLTPEDAHIRFWRSVIREHDNDLIPLLYQIYISHLDNVNALSDKNLIDLMSNLDYLAKSWSTYEVVCPVFIARIKEYQSTINILNTYRNDKSFDLEAIKSKSSNALLNYQKLIKALREQSQKYYDPHTKELLAQYENDTSRLEQLNSETQDTTREVNSFE